MVLGAVEHACVIRVIRIRRRSKTRLIVVTESDTKVCSSGSSYGNFNKTLELKWLTLSTWEKKIMLNSNLNIIFFTKKNSFWISVSKTVLLTVMIIKYLLTFLIVRLFPDNLK